jgi:gamma-glutamylcyclotransferase (GGCT)/AIG2-like uncharacterized protein YtfP
MSSEYLWVYGTLRHGCSNPHAHLLRRASRYLGIARVQARLYRVPAKAYPGVRLGGSADDAVVGDLFQILDRSALAALDQYEGPAEYHRVQAQAVLENGATLRCWVYEYTGGVSESGRIASGDWLKEG